MAGRGPQTFKKRQKEQARKEKQQEKAAKRLERKKDGTGGLPDEDELQVLDGPIDYSEDDLDRPLQHEDVPRSQPN
jgi:hypothetical protein